MKKSLTGPDALIAQDIETRILHALIPQDSHHLSRETAPRYLRVSLHEQDDLALVHETRQASVKLFLRFNFFWRVRCCGRRLICVGERDGGGGTEVCGDGGCERGGVSAGYTAKEGVTL